MSADALSITFQALADPTRRAILSRLAQGEATVQELADPLPISQPAVSKHLKVLEEAGLVERRKDAQRRWCRLRAKPLKEVAAFAYTFQEYWDESFARLDALLEEEMEREREEKKR
ncbi:MAG TPA: metalloregulator ArsR/SmtB family transcription factor [Candidatus Thermoplasmatota archaeon]|nr:metalloregulator ArsR/SmtB family transcription factor [Candidatus Thermoplasmatota archaeon]